MKITDAIATLECLLETEGNLEIMDDDGWPTRGFTLVKKEPGGVSFDGVFAPIDEENLYVSETWYTLDKFIVATPGG